MNGVRHQKWWGWGEEGIAFNHSDKPKLAPFVLDRVGIDLHAPGTPPPALSDIAVPYGKPHRGAVEPQHDVLAYLHQSHRSGRRERDSAQTTLAVSRPC